MPVSPLIENARVAVVGTGPAGLMVAFALASSGVKVDIFEKRRSSGRKLLIAGSSGLNISYDCPESELHHHYRESSERFNEVFRRYSRNDWIAFVESLGLETFKGTSRRYFVREMKASGLLKAWNERLKSLAVRFEFGKEAVGFDSLSSGGVTLRLSSHAEAVSSVESRQFDAVCFCLGGGSWEPDEVPLRWPQIFTEKGIAFRPFASSNTGFEVDWPASLLKEAEGLPLKNVELKTGRGVRKGEMVITRYGLEGTPVYAVGASGAARIDLKPDLSVYEIKRKLKGSKNENLAPLRRIKKYLNFCEASQALLFHLLSPEQRRDFDFVVSSMKNFAITLKQPRPLSEAISASGGIDWSEVNEDLMLKNFPGVFVAGEMLNWDAPTGGFLIQGCVSLGHLAGGGILTWLLRSRS
jgi:uncharacterized flavoprotein (TIGR03862 family)